MICISLGHDVIAQAQSGTGKTATFSIAILEQVDVTLRGCQALVLAPTRELAQQVYISRQICRLLNMITNYNSLFLLKFKRMFQSWWNRLQVVLARSKHGPFFSFKSVLFFSLVLSLKGIRRSDFLEEIGHKIGLSARNIQYSITGQNIWISHIEFVNNTQERYCKCWLIFALPA